MPLAVLAWLIVAVAALLLLAGRGRWHPFIALFAVALGFGVAIGQSTSLIGKSFGTGFGAAMEASGLMVVGAALLSSVAQATGAAPRLRRWPDRARAALITTVGLVAGLGAAPLAAFAALTPLRRLLDGPMRGRAAFGLALAMLSANGLVPPAPSPMAAAAILGAGPFAVLLRGLPAALAAALAGALFLGAIRHRLPGTPAGQGGATFPGSGRVAAGLLVAALAMVALLIVQSLGDIASEPLGGGPRRELLLGVGRPPVLLAIGLVVALAAGGRRTRDLSSGGWIGRALADAAGPLLTIAAAGGLQGIIQATGAAEAVGETLLPWRLGPLVPFALAALLKSFQGSSLVAAIAAAGMVQPELAALGLGDPGGRALAACAVGIGAMTVCHVNDGLFWLVTGEAGVRPDKGAAVMAVGGLVQAAVAMAVLFATRLF